MEASAEHDFRSKWFIGMVCTMELAGIILSEMSSLIYGFLIHQLQFIQFLIQPILRQQLLMGSGFFYFPVMHHNNFICMLDRRKPVRDHDRSSSIHQPCKCLCDQCFGFCIDVGSCFIENKDLRIISKCPCEGQKLALPGR